MIDKVCPVCGKKFIVSHRGNYLYKSKDKNKPVEYYCGYNCYHKAVPDKQFNMTQVLHAKTSREGKE